jgi:acyl transferase domain-containing protein/acyl carrier protein
MHGLIPPTVHFTTPNPRIDFTDSPFRVSGVLSEWPAGTGPRRAGVSSFGIGGTNAHVLLEEAPPQQVEPATPAAHLLVLSAKTSAALDSRAIDLGDHLCCRGETAASELADIAFTLQTGREALAHRRAVVCSDADEALRLLQTADASATQHTSDASSPRVAFLFPGQGSLRVGAAGELYRGNPAFRELIDDCCERLRSHVEVDPRAILCPKPEESAQAEQWLRRTSIAQPALFVLEYALAQLLQSHGIRPVAMLGHSLGELVAAAVAGVFSLDDALALIAERGRLAETMPPGAMLAVAMDETTLSAVLDPVLDIAAINGPDQCVVSGAPDAIACFEARLSRDGVVAHRLPVVNAFHGRGTDPLLADFTDLVARTQLQTPTVPYMSNVTGAWISEVEASSADYYARHLRSPVRFHEGLSTLLADPDLILIELGPGTALARLARRHPASDRRLILSALDGHDGVAGDAHFLRVLGRLWVAGQSIDFTPLHHGRWPRRVALSGYRFEHTRHWIDLPSAGACEQPVRPAVEDWFYLPSWRETPAVFDKSTPECRHWLVIGDDNWLVETLTELLLERGDEVRQLPRGATPDQYARVLDEMGDPEHALGIIHAGVLLGPDAAPAQAIERGYTGLLSLARALDGRVCGNLRLTVITDGLLDVAGESPVMPEKTMLLGPLKVLPQEYPGLACRGIDIIPALAARARNAQAREVLQELDAAWGEPLVALRGRHRWVPVYQTVNPANLADGPGIRPGGVYMITGGLGGVGLVVAQVLAEAGARLVLVSRSGVAGRPPDVIDALAQIEAMADAVDIAVADIADAEAMAAVVARTRQRFGPIIGVVHAAGETRDGTVSMPLGEIGAQETAVALYARAGGLRVLDQVLAEEPVEFALAISSNAAVLGGLGLGAYSAACHCMEALAMAADAKLPWISADWDRWPTLRSAKTYTETRTSIDRYAFSRDEATAALGLLSGHTWRGKVVVSAGDLSPRLARWLDRRSGGEPPSSRVDLEPGDPSVAGTTVGPQRQPVPRAADKTPNDAIEERLITLFRDLIGAGAIGPHDNFFELGGDSLVGVQLIARAGQAFGVRLPVESLFEHPTVAALADFVRELLSATSRNVRSPALVLSDGDEEGEI